MRFLLANSRRGEGIGRVQRRNAGGFYTGLSGSEAFFSVSASGVLLCLLACKHLNAAFSNSVLVQHLIFYVGTSSVRQVQK